MTTPTRLAIVLLCAVLGIACEEDCADSAVPALVLSIRDDQQTTLRDASITYEYRGNTERYTKGDPSGTVRCSDLRENCTDIYIGLHAGRYTLGITADGFLEEVLEVEAGGELCEPETVLLDIVIASK